MILAKLFRQARTSGQGGGRRRRGVGERRQKKTGTDTFLANLLRYKSDIEGG